MLIYQYFCGRHEGADMISFKGEVFKRMMEFNWNKIKLGGYEIIYLLGAWDYRGPILVNEEDTKSIEVDGNRTPSCFAISNHLEPHPDLGTVSDLKNLIAIIQDCGLKVMIDFVPNQTATNHQWVQKHPDYYQHDGSELKRGFSGDVHLLDYQNEKVRGEMEKILVEIVKYGVDGVRCDMAHWVPVDFWKETIVKIKSINPQLLLLGEAYSDSVFNWKPLTDLIESGFDMVYHEFCYRLLKQVFQSHDPIEFFVGHLKYITGLNINTKLVHFSANHDDPLLPQVLNLNQAITGLLLILPGSLLIPNGQLNNFDHRLSHHKIEILPWNKSELNIIPAWFKNITMVKNSLKPTVESVDLEAETIIRLNLDINGNKAFALANMGSRPYSLSEAVESQKTGMLHHLTSADNLKQGEFELFL